MITDRFSASSIVLKQQQLWVTGGIKRPFTPLNSTEIVTLNQPNSIQGPELPFTIYGHTMVQIDPKTILIIGGYQNHDISRKTWFVDLSIGFEIKKGPSLYFARSFHSCSKMIINGKVFIVVAGGGIKGSLQRPKRVELLDSTLPEKGWFFGMHF